MKEKKENHNLFYFVNLIVTFFEVGNMKLCPGTWGSIATLPFWIFINFLLLITGIVHSVFLTFFSWVLITGGLFALGVWASNIYMKQNKVYDAPEIVIDEVVGQLITYIITTTTFILVLTNNAEKMSKIDTFWSIMVFLTLMLIVPIILFRIFDITKPWFIGKIDQNRKDGIGVMIDDVIAGVIAGILSSILIINFV